MAVQSLRESGVGALEVFLKRNPEATPQQQEVKDLICQEGRQADRKQYFFQVPLLMWAATEGVAPFRVGYPAPNDLITKIPPGSAQPFGFC